MAKLDIQAGATSVSLGVFIQDSSSTTGAGLTGLVFNTAGLTCYAVVPGSSAVAITLATLAAANSAWSSGGFKEIESTNMQGWYRFDVPNTNISTGRSVGIHLKGATNMAPLPFELSLTAINNQSTGFGLLNASANVVQINSVSTSSVTTVAAVLGTTIAPTFTSALMKVDVTDWAATAVSTPATAGIPEVNIKNINNVSASPVTTVKAVQGLAVDGVIPTATNLTNAPTAGDFTATMKTSIGTAVAASAVASVTARVTANTDQLAGQTVSAAAGVTFPASVASPTNITAGTMTTTTNLTNAPTSGDFTATMKTSIGTAVAASAVASVTAAVATTSNIKKNQALTKFQFLMTDSTTHVPQTGLTVTCTRSIDGGAFAAGALVNVAEVGSGTYVVDFGASDLNGNVIVLKATAASADTAFERIVTQP